MSSVKVFDIADPEGNEAFSPLFNASAIRSITFTGSWKFWRQFRWNQSQNIMYRCNFEGNVKEGLDLSSCFPVKSESSLSVVETFKHAGVSHHLLKWSGGLFRHFPFAVSAGLVVSIAKRGECAVVPFATGESDAETRLGRIIIYSLLSLFGMASFLAVLFGSWAAISGLLFSRLDHDWFYVLGFGCLVSYAVSGLGGGVVALRNEYISSQRGFESPRMADLHDVTEVGRRLFEKITDSRSDNLVG